MQEPCCGGKSTFMNTNTLTPELLHKMDAYWRAANYLSVGQICLYDNPLLKRTCRRFGIGNGEVIDPGAG